MTELTQEQPEITSIELTSARKYLLTMFVENGIAVKWNQCTDLHKKPASTKTISRWMRKGPNTKNVRFEPWLLEFAASEGWVKPTKVSITATEKVVHLLLHVSAITDDIQAAVIVSMKAYAQELQERDVRLVWTGQQVELIDAIYAKYGTL